MSSSALVIWGMGLAFGLLHSLLAGRPCKRWATARGIAPQRYRLFYTVQALLLTGGWLALAHALPDRPLYRSEGMLFAGLAALQVAGLAVALLSLRQVDVPAFLGLRPFPDDVEPFHDAGIYRLIRHPMYAGMMLALLAMPVQSENGLNFALAVSLYFVIGSRFEERRMAAEHPEYTAYRQRVPAFVPWKALFAGRAAPR